MIIEKLKKTAIFRVINAIFNVDRNASEIYLHVSEIKKWVISLREITLLSEGRSRKNTLSNPLNKFGKKCFSQSDEDGITLEILRRIDGLSGGVYAEYGVGDGTENNTLILAALGWKGFWVGGEDLKPNIQSDKFSYQKTWITLDNIFYLTTKGMVEIKSSEIDVVSLDLDGNDIYFVEELLKKEIKPKLFIVEYNGKFPPPIEFKIKYDPGHRWNNDDYFGASLTSYVALFSGFGYRLVCCNLQTGANAFFIENSYERYFSDIPNDIQQLYVEPSYHLNIQYGHKTSLKTIEGLFD